MIEVISDVFLIVLLIAFVINLVLYLNLFSKLAFYKNNNEAATKLPKVSVVLSSKNEDENLQKFLPVILDQDYPEFEVIVVNDQSVDDTKYILEAFEKQYKRLQVVTVSEHINEHNGKKLPLTLGIKRAKNEILLLTDADCRPLSNQWIRSMVKNFIPGKDIVIGYSPYKKSNSILNLFIQFDTFYTAIQYFSFTIKRKPYMAVGRNLAYRRSFFFENKGFSRHLTIPFGDDDLFVNDNATPDNVAIELHSESFVESLPKTNLADWLHQKRRHLISGHDYKSEDKNKLAWVWFSQAIFYMALIPAAIFSKFYIGVLIILFLKLVVMFIIYGKALSKLNRQYLLFYIIFLDPLYHLFLIPFLHLTLGKSSRKNVW
jgi:glycosyltransferase involved in cell wall biosynthesis